MAAPFVSLLTDFGTADPWVAICKGVILSIVPDARLLDIRSRHPGVQRPRRSVRARVGAAGSCPSGCISPSSIRASERHAGRSAIRVARGDVLVGPDNGLLMPGADALGGVVAGAELVNPVFRRGRRITHVPRPGHLRARSRAPRGRGTASTRSGRLSRQTA